MSWRDGLFAHWPMDPSRVRSVLPDELDVDSREGTAWVSALASVAAANRPWFLPRTTGVTFPQVNLRTYVRREGRPGVYFLSLDIPSAVGVRLARSLYGLPYHRADIDFETDGEDDGATRRSHSSQSEDGSTRAPEQGSRRFESQRPHTERPPARFAAEYRPTGRPTRAEPGSLQDFLAERYRTYAVRNGTVWCARVEHAPWRLCPAEARVHADSLFEAAGLSAPDSDPAVRYAPSTEMTIRTPFRC